jgi:hypothetical protein
VQVAIRGTFHMRDVLVDMTGRNEEFHVSVKLIIT